MPLLKIFRHLGVGRGVKEGGKELGLRPDYSTNKSSKKIDERIAQAKAVFCGIELRLEDNIRYMLGCCGFEDESVIGVRYERTSKKGTSKRGTAASLSTSKATSPPRQGSGGST